MLKKVNLHLSLQSCNLFAIGKVTQSCLTLCDSMDYIVHGSPQAKILEWVAFPFSRDLPNPKIEPKSPALQVDSLPAEPQGKPKNTGMGSLSLLQQIFLTQESNRSLLHYRWILYQLSYQGSPFQKSLMADHCNKCNNNEFFLIISRDTK